LVPIRASSARALRLAVPVVLATGIAACASGGRIAPASAEAARTARAPAPVGGAEDGVAGDLARLGDPSFVERSRAAERLVARGEAVVPALGAAGDRPVRVAGGAEVATTRPVLRAILARADDERLVVHLASEHATVRREAAEAIGERGRWGAIPHLIDRLEDPDEAVRGASHAALRRLTNRSHGYLANAAAPQRAAATGRWRAWWNVEGRARADREADRRS
jgi:hypothetical protein